MGVKRIRSIGSEGVIGASNHGDTKPGETWTEVVTYIARGVPRSLDVG